MEPSEFYDRALEPVTLSVPPHPPPPPLLLPPRASRALRMSRELGSREQGETRQDRTKHLCRAAAVRVGSRGLRSIHSVFFACKRTIDSSIGAAACLGPAPITGQLQIEPQTSRSFDFGGCGCTQYQWAVGTDLQPRRFKHLSKERRRSLIHSITSLLVTQ